MNNSLKMLSPFVLYCQKVIPLAFDESMSYYECLCALYNYLKQEVVPAINQNAEELKKVETAIAELKQYIDDYFKDLDVQEEINNKLDDMAEQGQLADIIAQYLGLAGVLAFDTVADMVAGENLADGSICKTLGYSNYLDGGGRYYKVREILNTDVVDGVNIIALDVSDDLIAELIPEEFLDYIDDIKEIADFQNAEFEIIPIRVADDMASGTIVKMQDKVMLVDFGLVANVTAYINYLVTAGITKFDYAIITHFDQDHIASATGFETIVNSPYLDFSECKFIYHQRLDDDLVMQYYKDFYDEIDTFLKITKGYEVYNPKAEGEELAITDNIKINFYNCASSMYPDYYTSGVYNNFSLISLIHVNEYKILLTGDSETLSEEKFAPELPYDIDVIQIPHHGVNYATADTLIKRMAPNCVYYLINSTETAQLRPYYQQALNRCNPLYTTNDSLQFYVGIKKNKLYSYCLGAEQSKYNYNSNIKSGDDLDDLIFLDTYICPDSSIVASLSNMPISYNSGLYANGFIIKNVKVSTYVTYQYLYTVNSQAEPFMRKTLDGTTFTPWLQVDVRPMLKGKYKPNNTSLTANTWTTIASNTKSFNKWSAPVTLGTDGVIHLGDFTNTGSSLKLSGTISLTDITTATRIDMCIAVGGVNDASTRTITVCPAATNLGSGLYTSYQFDYLVPITSSSTVELKVLTSTTGTVVGNATNVNVEII